VGILRLPLGSPRTKSHLNVAPVESYRVYYKGEGGGFPQVRTMVNLVCLSCPWLVLAPKVLQLCTNHLVLVLCRSMWIIEACQTFLVPSRSFSTSLYPSKVLWARERPQLLPFPLFSIWDSHLSPSRSWERVTNKTATYVVLNINTTIIVINNHMVVIQVYARSKEEQYWRCIFGWWVRN
jgi:hypothetical protein